MRAMGASVASTDARVDGMGASVELIRTPMRAMGASVASTDARVDGTGASLVLIETRMSDKLASFPRMNAPIGGMRVPGALMRSRVCGRAAVLALVGAPLPEKALPDDKTASSRRLTTGRTGSPLAARTRAAPENPQEDTQTAGWEVRASSACPARDGLRPGVREVRRDERVLRRVERLPVHQRLLRAAAAEVRRRRGQGPESPVDPRHRALPRSISSPAPGAS